MVRGNPAYNLQLTVHLLYTLHPTDPPSQFNSIFSSPRPPVPLPPTTQYMHQFSVAYKVKLQMQYVYIYVCMYYAYSNSPQYFPSMHIRICIQCMQHIVFFCSVEQVQTLDLLNSSLISPTGHVRTLYAYEYSNSRTCSFEYIHALNTTRSECYYTQYSLF